MRTPLRWIPVAAVVIALWPATIYAEGPLLAPLDIDEAVTAVRACPAASPEGPATGAASVGGAAAVGDALAEQAPPPIFLNTCDPPCCSFEEELQCTRHCLRIDPELTSCPYCAGTSCICECIWVD